MFELSEQVFTCVQPLLATNSRRGRPWRDHRQVLGGILWKLHTGRPWRDVPGRFGPWQTCHGRLRRWQADGTWLRIWALVAAGEHRSTEDRRGQPVLAAAPVTAAGAGLMATPPPRPPQHLPHCRWRPPHQATSSRWASAVETRTRSEPGGCGSSARSAAPLSGLDHYQVRRWDAWYRHVSLVLVAQAFLAAVRAQAGEGGS